MIVRDPSLDALVDLDGEMFVIDDEGGYWVKFEVKPVNPTEERPHGLRYSLTMHAAWGERLVGFDNAHPVAPSRGTFKDRSERSQAPAAHRAALRLPGRRRPPDRLLGRGRIRARRERSEV